MQIDQFLNRPHLMGYEARRGIETLAHHLCSGLSLTPVQIAWMDWIPTAAINSRGDLLLSAIRDDARITRPVLHRYVGFVVHELLHRRYTNFSTAGSVCGPNAQYRKQLLNAVEDARIERHGIRSNLLGNIEGCLHALIGDMVTRALVEVQDWSDPAQYPFAIAVALRDFPGLSVPMPAQVQEITEQARARMPALRSTEDALALSEWIYEQLEKMEEEEERGEDGEPGEDGEDKPGEDGEPGDGKPGEDGQDGEPGDGEPQDGQGDGEPCEGESGDGQDGQDGEGEQGEEQRPRARRPQPGQQAREVEPNTGNGPEHDSDSGTWSRESQTAKNGEHLRRQPITPITRNVPARLRYEVRRLFDNTGTDMEIRNRKTGALDRRALARHQVTDRLFTKRLEVEGVDSDVVICLDISGSMYELKYGPRINAALSAAHALMETLHGAGADVAVVTFGDQASVAVPFGTNKTRALEIVSRIGSQMPGADGTNDWAALRMAHEMLLSRRAHRRVVFVVSDGVGNVEAMQRQVQAGVNLGITSLGLGIGESVDHIYGTNNSSRVDRVEDLGAATFTRVKVAA